MPAPPATDEQTENGVPFSDILAEELLLAAVMASEGDYRTASRLVNAAAFWRPAHSAIWAAVAYLRSRDLPCGPALVSDRMRQAQDHIEYTRDVVRIYGLPWIPAETTHHARLIARAAVRRHVHSAAVRAAQSTTLADHDGFRRELGTAIDRLTALATAWDGAT